MPTASDSAVPASATSRLVRNAWRNAVTSKALRNQRADKPRGGNAKKVLSLNAAPITITSGPTRNR